VAARALEVAARLAEGPPLVFAAIKEVQRESARLTFAEAMRGIATRRFPTVAALYASEDQHEGAQAFAEKRSPVWRGR
jgi:crotonobetainyl-CoA hydratase